MDLTIVVVDLLRLMLHTGNRKVDRQDGEGVDEQVIPTVDVLLHLFLRTILLTEEARSLGECLLVDTGSCRDHSGRVPLYLYR